MRFFFLFFFFAAKMRNSRRYTFPRLFKLFSVFHEKTINYLRRNALKIINTFQFATVFGQLKWNWKDKKGFEGSRQNQPRWLQKTYWLVQWEPRCVHTMPSIARAWCFNAILDAPFAFHLIATYFETTFSSRASRIYADVTFVNGKHKMQNKHVV